MIIIGILFIWYVAIWACLMTKFVSDQYEKQARYFYIIFLSIALIETIYLLSLSNGNP